MRKLLPASCGVFAFLLFVLYLCAAGGTAGAEPRSRLRGRALQPGDCIGVLASGSYADDKDFQGSLELLKAQGYRVKLAPSAKAMYEHFAGTDRKRAADINAFFQDDEVKAILCVRGGYGSARLLDRLDYKMIARHPKPFIGFSDVTALHIALGERAGIATIHGPMLISFTRPNFDSDYTRAQFFEGLRRTAPLGGIPMPEGRELETVMPGEAEGMIVGGNLTVLTSLVGTPYELNGKGALLLLEEVGERPYRIDRMLNQLWQSGLLSRVNGILLGDFVGCENANASPIEDFTLSQVLTHYARLSHKPVLRGVPAGHASHNLFLPLGVHAIMRAEKDGKASLEIDAAAYNK
ncbi:MAG: LD-carboxypeptidase [Synergistaceae bacterium]|nr:LD-carboxypeptidase [Synergistaceae bacterium]